MCFSHQQKGRNKKPGNSADQCDEIVQPNFHGEASRNRPKAGQDQDMLFVEQDLLWEAS